MNRNSFMQSGDARGFSQSASFKPNGIGAGARIQPVNWGQVNLDSITKSFYREHQEVARRSASEVSAWLEQNAVNLRGDNIPRPIFHFDECSFPVPIDQHLSANYPQPTTIQSISWPVALSGRDMISIAHTGSGKTLAFLLPGIVHTLMQPKKEAGDGPSMLVLLPTRELAQQVEKVAQVYCRIMNLGIACLFGGAARGDQARALRSGVDICVATPGRLLEFVEEGMISLHRCSYVVLDEADRMLDMGFEPQIRKIVSQIRPDRQTLMFSATWPEEIRALAMEYQTNPVFLNVGSLELSANHNIQQYVEVIQEQDKSSRLIQLLTVIGQSPECKTMIFVETKRKADYLATSMQRNGWPTLCIHGDKSQLERDQVMKNFRESKSPILLATDVVARGLDITDIKYVINFDYPKNSQDYVHRIGRTARHDRTGTSYTFFTAKDAHKAKELIDVLQEAGQVVPVELVNLASGLHPSTSSGQAQFSSSNPRAGGGNKIGNSGDFHRSRGGGDRGMAGTRNRFLPY